MIQMQQMWLKMNEMSNEISYLKTNSNQYNILSTKIDSSSKDLKLRVESNTSKIEELMEDLKKKYTVVVVTHNMQQAVRVSDDTAFFLVGEMVEFGDTKTIFSYPKDKRTEDYITGRFG